MNYKYILTTILVMAVFSGTASAWLTGYDHRMAITVNNSGASELSYYQFNFTNDTNVLVSAGNMQASGADCRITDASDNLLPFWNETPFNATGTKIWVNATTLAVGDNTFYMYYGNAGASSVSNITNTFLFGDDFPGGGIDFGRWYDNKYAGNPVLTPDNGTAGIDDLGTAWGYLMTNGTNDYRMYYTGIDPGSDYDICLATSTDGQTWTRITNGINGTHKVIDDASAWAGPVWKENGTYHMLYKSTVPSAYTWYHVTSSDGISWGTKTQCTGTSGTEVSSVMKIGSTYHAWGTGASPATIYHFTSTDLEAWTVQNSGNPILSISGKNVICPDVFYNVDDSKYYLVASVTPYGASDPEKYYGTYRMWKADDLDFQTSLEVVGDILIFDGDTKDLLPDWEDGGNYDGQHFLWPDINKQIHNADEMYYYYSVENTLDSTYDFSQGLVYFSTVGAAITKAGESPPSDAFNLDKWTKKANADTSIANGVLSLDSTDASSSGIYTKTYNHSADGVIIEYQGKRGTDYTGTRAVGSMIDVDAMHKGAGGLAFYTASDMGLKCWNYTATVNSTNGTLDNIFYDMATILKPTEIVVTGAGLSVSIANTLESHPIGVLIPGTSPWYIKKFRVRKYTATEPTTTLGAEETGGGGGCGAYNITLPLGWSIIGWTNPTASTAHVVGTSIGGNCQYVVDYNGTTGQYTYHNMAGPESEDTFMAERGYGYWVKMSAETLWERDS